MKKFFMCAILFTLTFATTMPAFADRKLSAEEAQALFSNKTFDGYNEQTSGSYVVYSAPDETHNHVDRNGKRVAGKWSINDAGKHCVVLPFASTCADVVDKGEGVHHKIDGNVHTHTLKNFRAGDQR